MCLGQDEYVDLRAILRDSDFDPQALDAALNAALGRKPEKHDFHIDRRGQSVDLRRHMSHTGG